MKRSFPILLASFLSLSLAQAQDLFYYGTNSMLLEHENTARFKKEVQHKGQNRCIITTRIRSQNDKGMYIWKFQKRERIKIKDDQSLFINQKTKGESSVQIYREMAKGDSDIYKFSESVNGLPSRTGFTSRFLPLHLENTVTEFYSNGNLKSISQFKDNQLVSNQTWLRNGEHYMDSVFYSVEELPQFEFGDEFFNSYIIQSLNNSKYDLSQINDVVEIGWVIMETGEMAGVISLNGHSKELRQFLVKIIAEMPGNWEAARLKGKPVRYFMSIPLNFINSETQLQYLEFSSGVMHYNSF